MMHRWWFHFWHAVANITKVELLSLQSSCPTWWQNVHCLPRSDSIHNQLGSRTWLYNSHHLIMGRNWYATLVLDTSHHMRSNLMWNYFLFTFCILFCKWGVARFTQPHVHMYMFCPYVISTLYHLLEKLQMRTFKRYFSCTILLTTLHLQEMN
jgi:hypothetical protein